jgi:hypothetical protein
MRTLQLVVFIKYAEVVGRETNLATLEALLAKYSCASVLQTLVKFNALASPWKNQSDFEVDRQLCDLVFPRYRVALRNARATYEHRLAFNRPSNLFVMKAAFRYCKPETDPSGLLVDTDHGLEEIGLACLMANDLSEPPSPGNVHNAMEMAHNFLGNAEYLPKDDHVRDIVRTIVMMAKTSEQFRGHAGFVDLPKMFQQRVGLALEQFAGLALLFFYPLFAFKLQDLEANPGTLLHQLSYFRTGGFAPDMIQTFLEKVGRSEDGFRTAFKVQDQLHLEFAVFQQTPVWQAFSGVHACLDGGFLLDKAGRSLFWSLAAECPSAERKQLLDFWGEVFGAYVNATLAEYVVPEQLFRNPTFPNDDEAFDACLLEETSLVVFEHKASILRADAKFSGHQQRLQEELDKKFVKGEGGKPKGVAQLQRSVTRFLRGEALKGIDLNRVHKIYPVMVCLDRSVTSPFFAKYFNTAFRLKEWKRGGRVITPLVVLGITELENLLPYLHAVSLSAILESNYATKNWDVFPFTAISAPILETHQPSRNKVQERFDAVFQQLLPAAEQWNRPESSTESVP